MNIVLTTKQIKELKVNFSLEISNVIPAIPTIERVDILIRYVTCPLSCIR